MTVMAKATGRQLPMQGNVYHPVSKASSIGHWDTKVAKYSNFAYVIVSTDACGYVLTTVYKRVQKRCEQHSRGWGDGIGRTEPKNRKSCEEIVTGMSTPILNRSGIVNGLASGTVLAVKET